MHSDVMKTIQCARMDCRIRWDGRMGALDCLHDVTIYLYYALCVMLVEHSVCHEPISVLINVFMLLA